MITGMAQRQVNESSRDYWIYLMGVKRRMCGRVVRRDMGQGLPQAPSQALLADSEPKCFPWPGV